MKGALALAALISVFGFGIKSDANDVTYTRRIEPIFRTKCVPCHGQKNVGPFNFSTYEGISSRVELIRTQLLSKNMPPIWSHSDYGDFSGLKPLTDSEMVDFQKWIHDGMPKGGVVQRSDIETFVMYGSSLSLSAKPAERVRVEGVPYWKVETIDLPEQGGDLTGFTFTPDSPRALHSATLAIVPKDMKLPQETFGSMDVPAKYLVGVWTPGYANWRLPGRMAMKFPPHSKLAVQAHYSPTGRAESAGFKVEFQGPDPRFEPIEPKWITLEKKPLLIEANTAPIIDLTFQIEKPMSLISILPEARFYAGRIQLIYTKTGEKDRMVFESIRWDPYWVGNFQFEKPIKLEPGAVLKARFFYSNDETCRMNQGRTIVPIKEGPTASDEICRMHLLVGP